MCFPDFLMVVEEIPDSTLEQPKWKTLFFGLPLFFALGFVIGNAVNGPAYFNSKLWWCWPSLGGTLYNYVNIACVLLGLITTIWCMVRLCWYMYQTERDMDRFRKSAGDAVTRKKTIQVSKQGIA